MFKKIAFFALFLAVTGLFAATSINAQRLIKVTKSESTTDTLLEPVPEANEAVVMTQCENGGNVGAPIQNCGAGGTDDNWNTGNMNGQKAHYAEGRSIHYRAVFKNLTPGTPYTIVMGYDILKGSPLIHAIDYLTNYDDAIPNGNQYQVVPCGSLVNAAGHPCNGGTPKLISIDDDPDVPASIETPAVRNIITWGIQDGATLDLSYGTATVGGAFYERLVTITFTPTVENPVFGWAGHIALGSAWSAFNGGTGAGAISGSPYHMYNRPGGVNNFGGAGDLQLATSAITGPSAADAEITGRVIDGYGRAISSAKLTLTDALTGEVRVVYTNTFGFYTFKGVPVGDFFVMTAEHRRYIFVNGSVSFSLEDNISGLNFQASR